MMRFIYILCLFLTYQASPMHSQDAASRLIREVNTMAARNAIGGLTYGDISGSPYYTGGFVNSMVYLKNGDSATLPLRYDLYQDEIEFIRDSKIFWIIKNDISSIQYGSDRIIPEPLPDDKGKSGYFFVPESGHWSLYIRKKTEFSPYVPPQAYTEAIPNRFELLPDEYYLKQEGMPLREIRSKKVLTEILSGNQPALDFIKRSKIRPNNAQDLTELVRFMNNQ